MKQSTIIIIAVLVIAVLAVVAISVGIGLYFYFKRKKRNPFFGLQMVSDPFFKVGSPESANVLSLSDYKTRVSSYVEALKTKFGVSSLATKDQLDKAVTTDGFESCFYGLVDGNITESTLIYINPYFATASDFDKYGTDCGGSKDNIGKHVVYSCGITGCNTEGFYMYVSDESKVPKNQDTVTVSVNGKDVKFLVIANFEK